MTRYLLLALLGMVAGATSAAAPRFTGDATLQPPDPTSVDGRFTMSADLKLGHANSADGRFGLQAALGPDAKSLGAICGGGDALFRNGFEN